ncbi:MAG: hypothetical protein WCI74_17225, partial [Actinomycetes bacterium]
TVGFDHLRGYLHSQKLRWSYGAVEGRESATRIEQLSASSNVATEALQAGYAGLWIDRDKYAESTTTPTPTESELAAKFGAPIISDDGELAFFRLR